MKNLFSFFRKQPKKFTFCHLEVCTLCQLDCRGCWMRKYDYCGKGPGMMTHVNFVKFLNLNPDIKHIEISNSGEIFLNPDLAKMLCTAHDRRVAITAAIGTNFNSVTDEQIDAMVRYQLRFITISIDGASPQTYSWYRRGGDFDTVIENIKRLNAKKKELKSIYPILRWQYVIFPSNNQISEIRRAKKMAKSLNMKICFYADLGGFIPANRSDIEKETGLSWRENGCECGQDSIPSCSRLWVLPLINWDGQLFGCDINHSPFCQNMFVTPLQEAMDSELMTETKQMLLGGEKCGKSPCASCQVYKKIAKSGIFLKEKDMLETPWK